MKWHTKVAGTRESAPVLIADVATWRLWRGEAEPQDSFDAFEGENGPVTVVDRGTFVPCEPGGGVYEIGVGTDEVVVLQRYDSDDAPTSLHAALATREEFVEYLAGEIDVTGGIVIGDAWANGSELSLATTPAAPKSVGHLVFFVPLPAGRYLVLEGHDEDDERSWYRIVRGNATSYASRLHSPEHDERKQIMARVSFADPKKEVRALEDARRLVTIGRPDLALQLCERASPERAILAGHVRIFALVELEPEHAGTLAISLAGRWLAPAKSVNSANQVLGRNQIMEALEVVPRTAAVRELLAQVKTAPEPEVFIADGA